MKSASTFFIPLAAVLLMGQAPFSYHVTRTYPLGGDGSWDYVVPDPPNHRLFIARQNRVMVVDGDKGTLLGEVTGIKGAHGTAIAGASGNGFGTAGDDQAVIMFDAKTFKNLKGIAAAEDADAIIYDAPSDRVFTFNGDAHSSSTIGDKCFFRSCRYIFEILRAGSSLHFDTDNHSTWRTSFQ